MGHRRVEGRELTAQGNLFEIAVVLSPQTVFVELSCREVVQAVQAIRLTPLHERLQAIAVSLLGLLAHFVSPLGDE